MVSHVKAPPLPPRRERREQFIQADEGYEQFVLPCNTMVRPDALQTNGYSELEVLIINAGRLSFVQ